MTSPSFTPGRILGYGTPQADYPPPTFHPYSSNPLNPSRQIKHRGRPSKTAGTAHVSPFPIILRSMYDTLPWPCPILSIASQSDLPPRRSHIFTVSTCPSYTIPAQVTRSSQSCPCGIRHTRASTRHRWPRGGGARRTLRLTHPVDVTRQAMETGKPSSTAGYPG